ncbi:MAG: glycosyltransferase family 4 protein [Candidatus Pacebacteria bacterium]|nr:glycosyltransferase family 4 protein [Candidatus Paceibacterota bacterium]
MNLPKICFIIPEYDRKTPTHFNYLYNFIKIISEDLDVFLIVEKGGKPDISLKNGKIFFAGGFAPWRLLKTKLLIFYARFLGYRDFYVHYSFFAAYIASCITKIYGGRVFYWNCGLPWNYRRFFLRDWFERFVYKTVSFLVTGTEELKKEYARHYGLPLEKIKVMPNWIDVESVKSRAAGVKKDKLKANLDISPDKKIILFAHRLSKRKGAHYLPEILRGLKNENIVLLVAGDGPERTDLELKIKNDGLSDKARFLGWVPQEKIAEYFAISDLFLMPSEEEGFPHVILEAMAAEVPFLAFEVGGVKEIIPPQLSDFMALPGGINMIVSKAKELIKKPPQELNNIKSAEREWVKKFDISEVADKFKKLLI